MRSKRKKTKAVRTPGKWPGGSNWGWRGAISHFEGKQWEEKERKREGPKGRKKCTIANPEKKKKIPPKEKPHLLWKKNKEFNPREKDDHGIN